MPIIENGTNYPLAPQAFAETSPQFWPSYFVPRLGMSLEDAFASYGTLYRTQPWVYAAVRKVSRSIARLGSAVWDQSPETGQELDLDGPYAQLIANPCPEMSPSKFWTWTASTIEIYGETFWIKLREGRGRQVTGFVPLHPSLVQIFRDTDGQEMYRHMGRPGTVFPRDDIVPFQEFNPDNVMRGVSRLEPLRSTLMNEDSARRSMASTWKNGTRPTGVLMSERELGTLGRERLKMAWQSEHQGTGNHGRTPVLEDGVTFQPLESKAVDMAYLEARELNREEVAGVFDLPPSALQIMQDATFSNITENMRSLYRDSLAPRVEFIEDVINWEVGQEFNGPKVMKFAVAEVLFGAFEQRADAVAKLVQCGVMKPAEARQFFDLNVAGEEADRLYANQALVPLGQNPSVDGDQPALEDGGVTHVPSPAGGTNVPHLSSVKYVREISGLIGRDRTLQEAARELIAKTGDVEGVREACEFLLREANRVNVIQKNATVSTVESENPNGEFEVILSTETKDRDNENLWAQEWKTPLPARIHIDGDHGRSLDKTVGSAVPRLEGNQLVAKGTFASTDYAQMVRQLVNEGHINSLSVTYSESKNQKGDGVQRELLNAAFVAIPANPEAVVLSSKSAKTDKADGGMSASGNTPKITDMVQAIHDAACHLGAQCLNEIDADPGTADGANKGIDGPTGTIFDGLLRDVTDKSSSPEAGLPQESAEESAVSAAAEKSAAAETADNSADDSAKAKTAAKTRALAFLIKQNTPQEG